MVHIEEQDSASRGKKRGVLVVDDHPIVCEGLTDLINREDDLVVCGWASDIPEAILAIETLGPDVVTVDISLGDSSGLDLIKDITARYVDLPILALSMHNESFYAERAIRSGAKGYITKVVGTGKVIAAIRTVLEGRLYVSDQMKEKLLYGLIGEGKFDPSDSPIDRLTDRELQVFNLLGEGRGTREIAKQLHLSVKTIETYRARIKEKLHLSSSCELLREAFQWASIQDKVHV